MVKEKKYIELQKDFELMKNELAAARKDVEELKKENNQKGRECQEAWKSLNELQNELMRKSMHVGSLGNRHRLCSFFLLYYLFDDPLMFFFFFFAFPLTRHSFCH